jgi:hypothetical protein
MADVLLTLIMPNDVAQHVEDLLLSRPDLVPGFTANLAEGHGSVVPLVEAAELVSGHAPRTVIRTVGPEADKREMLALIKQELPQANIFFWLVPVIDKGRL